MSKDHSNVSTKTKIYYSHHPWKYGTALEKYEINLIRNAYPHSFVFNPSVGLDQMRAEKTLVSLALEQIKKSEMLVFSTLSGIVDFSTTEEIKLALSMKIPVMCISGIDIVNVSKVLFEETGVNRKVFAKVIIE